jgi:hypothetical protein
MEKIEEVPHKIRLKWLCYLSTLLFLSGIVIGVSSFMVDTEKGFDYANFTPTTI